MASQQQPETFYREYSEQGPSTPEHGVHDNSPNSSRKELPHIDLSRKLDISPAPAPAPAPASPPVVIANPGPLGLSAFALTTFMLSLFNAEVLDIKVHHVIIGPAMFYGGFVQVLAGMWEFRVGNLFGATAFSSYGAFWMSFAFLLVPSSGVLDAYKGHMDQFENAVGIFLLAWTIFTCIMFVGTFRKNIALMFLFGILIVTFILLTVGKFTMDANTTKAGGWFGVVTALAAWYNAMAGIYAGDKELSELIHIPIGPLSKKTAKANPLLPTTMTPQTPQH